MEPLEFLRRRWHRLRHQPLPQVPPLRPVSFSEPDELIARVRQTRPILVHLLTENIIPFWYPACLDEAGGYRLNHDPAGRWKGPAEKYLIPQARTCWFFSRLARTGRLPDALPAARQGYEFLRDHLWAGEQSGFSWSTIDNRKLLIGQTFALYGLSEYAAVSGDPGATSLARQCFAMIEARYRDERAGGYRSGDPTAAATPALKCLNDHLHLLEACTAFTRIADDPIVRARMLELILILTCTVLRTSAGATTERHRSDWTPLLDRDNARASYGHDLEATWLVLDACRMAGVPATLVLDWCRALFTTAHKWGWHKRDGGMYFGGPLNGPADCREKVWWVQAESLVAGLTLFQVTGDPQYARFYLGLLEWITTRQADWQGGDWHAIIWPSGAITGDKADRWKTPYHNGRAMLQCIDLLEPREVAD
jgi:mannose/cellobiose epimerase-like protein (N-acyl-D-glucosamine 2-epimerase family)